VQVGRVVFFFCAQPILLFHLVFLPEVTHLFLSLIWELRLLSWSYLSVLLILYKLFMFFILLQFLLHLSNLQWSLSCHSLLFYSFKNSTPMQWCTLISNVSLHLSDALCCWSVLMLLINSLCLFSFLGLYCMLLPMQTKIALLVVLKMPCKQSHKDTG
jgi:hypothetical protein